MGLAFKGFAAGATMGIGKSMTGVADTIISKRNKFEEMEKEFAMDMEKLEEQYQNSRKLNKQEIQGRKDIQGMGDTAAGERTDRLIKGRETVQGMADEGRQNVADTKAASAMAVSRNQQGGQTARTLIREGGMNQRNPNLSVAPGGGVSSINQDPNKPGSLISQPVTTPTGEQLLQRRGSTRTSDPDRGRAISFFRSELSRLADDQRFVALPPDQKDREVWTEAVKNVQQLFPTFDTNSITAEDLQATEDPNDPARILEALEKMRPSGTANPSDRWYGNR